MKQIVCLLAALLLCAGVAFGEDGTGMQEEILLPEPEEEIEIVLPPAVAEDAIEAVPAPQPDPEDAIEVVPAPQPDPEDAPFQVEAPCTHPSSYKAVYQENVRFVNVNDPLNHETHMDLYEHTFCNKCGADLHEPILTEADHVELWSHNYAEGVTGCVDCGYVPTCDHARVEETREEYPQSYMDEEDGRTHVVRYGMTITRKCAKCGIVLSTSQTSSRHEKGEPHSFGDDGVCELCGAVNECRHKHKTVYEEHVPFRFQDKGDGRTHTAFYCLDRVTCCSSCGIELKRETIETGLKEILPHSYGENGICVDCGFANACAHARTTVIESREVIRYGSSQEGTHTVFANLCANTICLDCGDVIDEAIDYFGGRVEEECTYDEYGQCVYCGYINTCKHPSTVKAKIFEVASCKRINAQQHWAKGTRYEVTRCESCGAVLAKTPLQDTEIKENHVYTLGVCSCGAVNACKHSKVEEATVFDGIFRIHSQYTHKFDGKAFQVKVCAACGETIGIVHSDVRNDGYYLHDFSGGSKQCRHCHYAYPETARIIEKGSNGVITVGLGQNCHFRVGDSLIEYCESYGYTLSNNIMKRADNDDFVGVKEGKTTLTVLFGDTKLATLDIKVVDANKPASVALSPAGPLTLAVGEQLTLQPVLSPSIAKTSYTWASGKARVASVSAKGEVKALSEGTAKITVTTANKKKATITVTVVDPFKPDSITSARAPSP